MPVRRHTDPNNIQYVWDSISSAKFHHQSPDWPTIIKFLQSEANCTQAQAETYVRQALLDGHIVKVDPKGGRLLQQPVLYRIPVEELAIRYNDGKDWYCLECHLAGDVTPCKFCHRVFHAECSKNVRNKQIVFQSIEKHKFLSSIVKDININASDINNSLNNSTSNSVSKINKEPSKLNDSANNLGSDTITKNIDSRTTFVYDQNKCSICNIHTLEDKCNMSKEELNHLLGFILNRIRSWLPSNLTCTMAPDQKRDWNNEADLTWRATQLHYQHMDMNVMHLKLEMKGYSKISEFLADVLTIQHNVAIFHGIESQEYGAADLMVRDTSYDVTELITCIDCYRHSNEKINEKWFCYPCRRQHKLVWAKQKGYPYWPAKVIKETETSYDVRFFGGKYERSMIPKNSKNILPIEAKPKNHEIKKSIAFNKALEELKLHQHLLENPNLIKKYITTGIQKDTQKEQKKMEPTTKIATKKVVKKTNQTSTVHQQKEGPQLAPMRKSLNVSKRQAMKRKSDVSRESIINKSKPSAVNLENRESSEKSNIQEIIPISDTEEDDLLPPDNYNMSKGNDGCYGQVSSSTEYFMSTDDGFRPQEMSDVMHPLEQPYSDSVEKMRRKLEQAKDKKLLINVAMDCMQQEIDRIINDHNENMKKLYEAHQSQISETKKKQWCYNCEQDAIYHCCWNTAYCSPTCQQQHWQAEHKKVCRRKR